MQWKVGIAVQHRGAPARCSRFRAAAQSFRLRASDSHTIVCSALEQRPMLWRCAAGSWITPGLADAVAMSTLQGTSVSGPRAHHVVYLIVRQKATARPNSMHSGCAFLVVPNTHISTQDHGRRIGDTSP
eukprot:9504161-Pyramimonas_sp.AAC.3